jgi:hypothetical protein
VSWFRVYIFFAEKNVVQGESKLRLERFARLVAGDDKLIEAVSE